MPNLARLGYVTRARMTQIMNLLNLAPEIQEQILMQGFPGNASIPERRVRHIAAIVEWTEQKKLWEKLVGKAREH